MFKNSLIVRIIANRTRAVWALWSWIKVPDLTQWIYEYMYTQNTAVL